MKIENFKKEHAYNILDQNVRDEELWLSGQDWEGAINIWNDNPAYTIIINDEIVACGGWVFGGYQNCETWVLFSRLFYKYYRSIYKMIKEKTEDIVSAYRIKKLQAIINPEHKEAMRFIEHLGFEKEYDLEYFGPNKENLIMYRRIV
jgi:hypothetical protein